MAEEIRDVIIIGGGISAHTAALYTARAKLNPLVLSGHDPDQLSLTTTVENFPGFPDGIMGPVLVENTRKQAQKFGAEYEGVYVDSFEKKKDYFELGSNDRKFRGRTVIISTGASPRLLGIPGEDVYFGKGVSTCAVCDAALYKGKEVVLVGGGDSAMEEAMALYKFADKVTLVHRRDALRASKIMQDRIFKLKDKVNIKWDTGVEEVMGDGKFVTGVKVKNLKTGQEAEIKADGFFLAIGHIPNTKIFEKKIKLDEMGYIITDKRAHTNVEGVYAESPTGKIEFMAS